MLVFHALLSHVRVNGSGDGALVRVRWHCGAWFLPREGKLLSSILVDPFGYPGVLEPRRTAEDVQ